MVIGQNFVRAGEFMESFQRILLSEIWSGFGVFQKLSGFIWKVECGEALRKCMESLKVYKLKLIVGFLIPSGLFSLGNPEYKFSLSQLHNHSFDICSYPGFVCTSFSQFDAKKALHNHIFFSFKCNS